MAHYPSLNPSQKLVFHPRKSCRKYGKSQALRRDIALKEAKTSMFQPPGLAIHPQESYNKVP
ncbi:MAG: hypothetical protein DWI26_06975 [Planctomycetota bacterium]|nr:MAG: hypothetical protein DWH99_02895 [Planctomycetota bacterium]RLT14165.1 MAG: hypothetical protein DWI26_06975 [Planctomycetota bacterium]